MSEAEVLARLKTLSRERLELELELEPASRLVEDLGLDSLRLQALAIEVENDFRICIEPEEEEEIVTVGDLVDVIERKMAEDTGLSS